MIEVTGYLKLD